MKRAILILVALLLISTGVVYSQASITGKVDVDVEILNAFNGETDLFGERLKPDVEFITKSDDTEVDIKAAVDDFSSITIQFRGADPGDNVTTAGITAGDIFVESNIIGAFGWSDSVPELVLKIKGGRFNPEPTEKGEVREVANIADLLGHDKVVEGGAALLAIGWTDWIKLEAGARFAENTGTDFGWFFGLSGEGSFAPNNDNDTAGKFGYSVHLTNQNKKFNPSSPGDLDTRVNDSTLTGSTAFNEVVATIVGEASSPLEIGVGIQYSGLQIGTIRSAGGAIAEPADVPVIELGIGAQVAYFLGDDLRGSAIPVSISNPSGFPSFNNESRDYEYKSQNYNQLQYGVNLSTTFLSFIELDFEVGGDDTNPLDGFGIELGLVNPGENVGRILTAGVEFTATKLGSKTINTVNSETEDRLREQKELDDLADKDKVGRSVEPILYTFGPELTLKAGNTGPKFRIALPFDLTAPENSKITLDVEFSF